jgi:hypothetical protein
MSDIARMRDLEAKNKKESDDKEMQLRDDFAKLYIKNNNEFERKQAHSMRAKTAYDFADAMMKARKGDHHD